MTKRRKPAWLTISARSRRWKLSTTPRTRSMTAANDSAPPTAYWRSSAWRAMYTDQCSTSLSGSSGVCGRHDLDQLFIFLERTTQRLVDRLGRFQRAGKRTRHDCVEVAWCEQPAEPPRLLPAGLAEPVGVDVALAGGRVLERLPVPGEEDPLLVHPPLKCYPPEGVGHAQQTLHRGAGREEQLHAQAGPCNSTRVRRAVPATPLELDWSFVRRRFTEALSQSSERRRSRLTYPVRTHVHATDRGQSRAFQPQLGERRAGRDLERDARRREAHRPRQPRAPDDAVKRAEERNRHRERNADPRLAPSGAQERWAGVASLT